ncbi:MAG: hypothetical protein EPN89_09520 [Methylovulum sp.]|nr:MAG: hypothetical protein EPN89_09520 [Methylovulum sp.]
MVIAARCQEHFHRNYSALAVGRAARGTPYASGTESLLFIMRNGACIPVSNVLIAAIQLIFGGCYARQNQKNLRDAAQIFNMDAFE